VSTVFFGGGTPSLMEPLTVAAILDAIAKNWSVSRDVEVTLEANPTSVEARRFAGYRAAGVNRVSLGVQALDDAALLALGRTHTAREALDAVASALATRACIAGIPPAPVLFSTTTDCPSACESCSPTSLARISGPLPAAAPTRRWIVLIG
jgi:hypothetical protein